MGAAHGGFEIEAVVNWARCKMGAAHYGIDIKVVGNWARGGIRVLKSRQSSTGLDARWAPPITGLKSRWLVTGHDEHPTLRY